ncbi:hypothetical protein SDC9_93505 [bioreactor metagenome]|uniref:Uroporphyrinogen decarboxylase (URO-D) domain-containing protein n=1 Tax=bioreactor metagenome TaxID=1076179 RepID=A0A645A0U3_9ZZZZ
MDQPDYAALRSSIPFSYHVSATYLALLDATRIPIKAMFLEPEAGVELYRRGRPLIRELYGEKIGLPAPITAPVSYGHVNTLGAELIFPDDGEVNLETGASTLAEGIAMLERPVDFARSGMFPFYRDYFQILRRAFPDEAVGFGFKSEGPMTTGYLLRRDGFFFDPYDNPEETKKFLALIVRSVVGYIQCVNQVIYDKPATGKLPSFGIADDVGAMFNPDLWDEFVLPYYNLEFDAFTDRQRTMHIEDLRPAHLPFLEKLRLVNYDPSVSPRLTPKIISENTRVPFQWRLCNFQYPAMSANDVKNWVFRAAADGASSVVSYVCQGMYNAESAVKVHAFIEAAEATRKALDQGAGRADIARFIA